MNPLHFFARFHGGHGGGSIWPLLRWLHDKMPSYLPEWLRWTLVAVLLVSLFFMIHMAIAKAKERWGGTRDNS